MFWQCNFGVAFIGWTECLNTHHATYYMNIVHMCTFPHLCMFWVTFKTALLYYYGQTWFARLIFLIVLSNAYLYMHTNTVTTPPPKHCNALQCRQKAPKCFVSLKCSLKFRLNEVLNASQLYDFKKMFLLDYALYPSPNPSPVHCNALQFMQNAPKSVKLFQLEEKNGWPSMPKLNC